jgi:hypothetical protein
VAFRPGLSLLILLHSSVECITVYDIFLYTHKWLLGVGGGIVGRDVELCAACFIPWGGVLMHVRSMDLMIWYCRESGDG